MVGRWLRYARGKRWVLILLLVLAVLGVGPWLGVFLLQLALVPLLAMWLPYLRVLPLLYSFRMQHLLARHYAALAEAEAALDGADDAAEARRRLRQLDTLHHHMRDLTRKLPASMQADVFHWRLHIDLVRRAGLKRLRFLEKSKSPMRRSLGGFPAARQGSAALNPQRRMS